MCRRKEKERVIEILKGEFDKGEKGMYVDMESDGDAFGIENFVEEEEMEVGIGEKVLVCGDEVGEKNMFALTEES